MREMTIEEIRGCELACLKAAHDFCVDKGLTYYLTFGTLIGAVRHKGFIPWDDDIDIIMPRNDYNRFIREFSMPGYRVVSFENEPRLYSTCSKLIDTRTVLREKGRSVEIGAFVDVFPLDNLPNGKFRRYFYCKWYYFMSRINGIAYAKRENYGSFWKRAAVGFVCLFFPRERIRKYFLGWKYPQRFKDQKDTRHYSLLYHPYPVVPELEAGWFESQVPAEFEGGTFFIPSGYDPFLRYCYGDYMKLPPVEQRVGRHTFDYCRWKEEKEENV